MAGSVWGNIFSVSTWGESHGEGLGAVVDGCPAGIPLCSEDIQKYLDKRKPGQTKYSTPRKEGDKVEILSGVFEGKTTGAPISLLVRNQSQRSADYSELASCYRPGHADFTFDAKYGFRDYRGGGRSSGRETIGRVAAGAIACKLLQSLGIEILTYTAAIGPVSIKEGNIRKEEIEKSPLRMPDAKASAEAEDYLEGMMKEKNSAGGIIECVVKGVPAGIGDPVFAKLDALLASSVFSIGAVKGVEIGAGFNVAQMTGLENNDSFYTEEDGEIRKRTNHAGGILGGISDGSDIRIRAAIKPTPSVFFKQHTVNRNGENICLEIKGRHDPVIVPRAVVVVESMVALALADAMLLSMTSRIDKIKEFFAK